MSLSIIVLAAGKGSRMFSSTLKVFHEVGNYPMLFHVLDTATSLSKSNINLVISKALKGYKTFIRNKYEKIEFSLQVKQSGTADAVKTAIKLTKKKIKNYTCDVWRYSSNFKTNAQKSN